MGAEEIYVLSEEAIKVYLVYMDQLKALFIKFLHPNWNAKKKVKTWRDIEEKND